MKNTTDKIITHKTTACSNCLLFLLMAIFLTMVSLSSCSLPRTTLESKAFSGTIIDEETGKPIANAVVMIKWPIVGGYEGNTRGSIEVAESVTDAKGRYAIAGWVKKGRKEIAGAFIYKNQPNMVIYAPGYWSERKFTGSYNLLPRGEAWEASWDGEAIELKPMHSEEWNNDNWEEYRQSIQSDMSFYFMPECPWLKTPNFYLVMHRMMREANNGGHTVLIGFLTKYRSALEKNCGVDPKDFFLRLGMTNKEFDECCTSKPLKPTPEEIRMNTIYFDPYERDPSIDGRSLDEINRDLVGK